VVSGPLFESEATGIQKAQFEVTFPHESHKEIFAKEAQVFKADGEAKPFLASEKTTAVVRSADREDAVVN
jgi:hypothetical protein